MPEVTEPSYGVAQAAYQTLMELTRMHPEDVVYAQAFIHATALLERLWDKYYKPTTDEISEVM